MIPLFKVKMSDTVSDELNAVLSSGYIGQGPKVDEFENLLKHKFSNENVVTTNSGTSAEHLVIHLLKTPRKSWPGIQPGDEILTTPLTCTATNWPILANGIKIKWVDADPKTMNVDLDDLSRKITKKTKAIMVVHWGGYPVDLNKLKNIQKDSLNLFGFEPVVIEDCAHAFGSKFDGNKIGNCGNICTFSFQAIKHLTCGDGGAITFPNKELYDRAKLLRWYGIGRDTIRLDFRCETDIQEWGFKFHMNDINATIGIENLKVVDDVINTHKSNALYYDQNLTGVKGIELLERDDRMESSFWLYTMLVQDRLGFMKHMKECGIMVSQVHRRNDIHTCVRKFKTHLPSLDIIEPKMISIPVGWWVTEEERQYIVDCIKKGW